MAPGAAVGPGVGPRIGLRSGFIPGAFVMPGAAAVPGVFFISLRVVSVPGALVCAAATPIKEKLQIAAIIIFRIHFRFMLVSY
jgi:hypothetical protein